MTKMTNERREEGDHRGIIQGGHMTLIEGINYIARFRMHLTKNPVKSHAYIVHFHNLLSIYRMRWQFGSKLSTKMISSFFIRIN
jgi:hypothetical protein